MTRMPEEHKVRQGDCLSSIAARYGHRPETIWDDSANSELKRLRKDPEVLFPGDVLVIPDLRRREESGATDQRHRFRRKGVVTKLKLQLLDEEHEPRADVAYSLNIDGDIRSDRTDGEGFIEEVIPPGAERVALRVGEGDDAEEYELHLGNIDPVEEDSGVQQRLKNLGYDCGRSDGQFDDDTRSMVRAFQKQQKLDETGDADDKTRSKLKQVHGS